MPSIELHDNVHCHLQSTEKNPFMYTCVHNLRDKIRCLCYFYLLLKLASIDIIFCMCWLVLRRTSGSAVLWRASVERCVRAAPSISNSHRDKCNSPGGYKGNSYSSRRLAFMFRLGFWDLVVLVSSNDKEQKCNVEC